MSEDTKPKSEDTKPKKAAKSAADDVELIAVRKDGEALDVHPSCLEAHLRAGWKVA